MTTLAPIVLFGWIPFSIFLFSRLPAHKATFYSFIFAMLFLPMASFKFSFLPAFTKISAASYGVIAGVILFDFQRWIKFKFCKYDLPIIIFCLCPIATSLSNNLGLWDGLSASFSTTVTWFVPYLAGRMYVYDRETLFDLARCLLVGGLVYLPFVLYEVRMSPNLHLHVYGYNQGSFLQTMRYGGWRPKVFMQHGLMVALWMALTSIIAFWFWRAKSEVKVFGLSPGLVFLVLAVTTVLCKSGNGVAILFLGCFLFYVCKITKTTILIIVLLLAIPGYTWLRSTGQWSAQSIKELVLEVSDEERAGSLGSRMRQEDLFSQKAQERPLLGWGGWKRSFPLDEEGRQLTRGVDSLWVIVLGENGYIGLYSMFLSLLTGPYLLLLKNRKLKPLNNDSKVLCSVALALVVVLFAFDCLFNAMINLIYITLSGGLLSIYLVNKTEAGISTPG